MDSKKRKLIFNYLHTQILYMMMSAIICGLIVKYYGTNLDVTHLTGLLIASLIRFVQWHAFTYLESKLDEIINIPD